MKKLLALMLGLVMIFSLSTTAFAAGEQTGTTTLTAEVPDASYTLHIPAAMTLEYGNTEKQIFSDKLYVENVQNASKVLFLAPFTDLINTSDSSDTIALNLCLQFSGLTWDVDKTTGKIAGDIFDLYNTDYSDPYQGRTFYAQVTDWSGATRGATYQAVITFNVWAE